MPILSYFLFSKKIHRSVWPSVLLCLVGGLFLSELSNIRVRFGDSLVVAGAFFWALHIIYIAKFIKIFNYPITIATFQCLTASIMSFIPAFSFEYISLQVLLMESKELLYAGVLSSGIAFSASGIRTTKFISCTCSNYFFFGRCLWYNSCMVHFRSVPKRV